MKRIINFFKKIFKVHSPSEKNMPLYANDLDNCHIAYDKLRDAFHRNNATKDYLKMAIHEATYYLEKILLFSSNKSANIQHAYNRLLAVYKNPKATKADLRLAMANANYDLYLAIYTDGESVV